MEDIGKVGILEFEGFFVLLIDGVVVTTLSKAQLKFIRDLLNSKDDWFE